MQNEERRRGAPWSPFSEMARWEQIMGKRLDNFLERRWPMLSRRWPHGFGLDAEPPVEVFDDHDELVVRVELPGIDKNDVEIAVRDQALTISGEKKQSAEHKENYYHSEISYGVFSRVIDLPYEVQADNARAFFDKGILEVRLAKTESAKKSGTRINIL
jgi:HSP20 family protein